MSQDSTIWNLSNAPAVTVDDRIPVSIGSGINDTYYLTVGDISAFVGTDFVRGPNVSTDNAIPRFDGTDGMIIQNSLVTIDDNGAFTFPPGVTQTFVPNATNSGFNVGARNGQPANAVNGDIFYNTSNQRFRVGINGQWRNMGTVIVAIPSTANNAIALWDGTTGEAIKNSLITVSTTGALGLPDGIRQTFNPDPNNAGLNVGSVVSDPTTIQNGDIIYNTTDNQFRIAVNGAWQDIGGGGGDVVGPNASTDNAIARYDGGSGKILENSNILITDAGRLIFQDNLRQTFNPGVTNAGLNVGSVAANPTNLSNDGDIVYITNGNQLRYLKAGVWSSIVSIDNNIHNNNAISRYHGQNTGLVQNSLITISDIGTFGLPNDTRQTFNPGTTNAGINVGQITGSNPTNPVNGDIVYRTNSGLNFVRDGAWTGVVGHQASHSDNAIVRWDGLNSNLVQNSGIQINDQSQFIFPDNNRQTFNPGNFISGLNVGIVPIDPLQPLDGDIVYNNTEEQFRMRRNDEWVNIGTVNATGDTADNEVAVWTANTDEIKAVPGVIMTEDRLTLPDSYDLKWGTGVLGIIQRIGGTGFEYLAPANEGHRFAVETSYRLTISDTAINSPNNNGIAKFQEAGVNISPIGIHDIYLDAGSATPVSSGDLATRTLGTGANEKGIAFIPFVTGLDTFCTFKLKLPRNYNNGTITAVINWTSEVEGGGDVSWGVSGVAVSNGDNMATAVFGTEIVIGDGQTNINESQDTGRTGTITLNNTPADGDTIFLKVRRRGQTGDDSFPNDAQLLGISVAITTDAAVSA